MVKSPSPSVDETLQSKVTAWIDLINPTEDEIAAIRERHGIIVPSRRALEKIEASSRLKAENDLLTMSAPLISGTRTDHWEVAPVGFVLSPKMLVTVRFAEIELFFRQLPRKSVLPRN